MEEYWKYKRCIECRDEVGDLWVSETRDVVEWVVGGECVRKFVFKGKGAVVRAGFTTFEHMTCTALVIVLRDLAHVYLLAARETADNEGKYHNGGGIMTTGESTTVCFPFPVKDAFMYRNGVILERDRLFDLSEDGSSVGYSNRKGSASKDNSNDNQIENEKHDDNLDNIHDYKTKIINSNGMGLDVESLMKQKYITLSDPMAPFGTLVFANEEEVGVAIMGSKRKMLWDQDEKDSYETQNSTGLFVKKKRRTESPLDLTAQTRSPQKRKQFLGHDGLKMVLFPADENHNITVLFDPHKFNLQFYYTRIMDNKSKAERNLLRNKGIAGAGHFAKKWEADDANNSNNANITNNNYSSNNNGLLVPTLNIQGKRHLSNASTESRLPSINSGNHNFHLRKSSHFNRRIPSIMTPVAEMALRSPATNLFEQDMGLNPNSSGINSKRSASATLDRMGSTHNDLIQVNLNGGLRIPSTNTTTNINDIVENYPKDAILTKISTIDLPSSLRPKDPNVNNIKCFPVRYHDSEGVIIVDATKHYCKLWTIELIPEILNSRVFQLSGDSPQNMIQLRNLSQINWEETFDVIPIDEENNNLCFRGCVALLCHGFVRMVNPFLDLYSPSLSRYSEISSAMKVSSTISNTFSEDFYFAISKCLPSIQSNMMAHIFKSLSLICPAKFFQVFVFQWYFVLGKIAKCSQNHIDCENQAFENVLISLIKTPDYPQCMKQLIDIRLKETLYIMEVENILPKIVMGLHLLREEYLLDVYRKKDIEKLGFLVKFLTTILRWPKAWSQYYADYELNGEHLSYIHKFSSLNNENYVKPLDEPTSILKSLSSLSCEDSRAIVPFIEFSRLVEMDSNVDIEITPRTYKITRLYEILNTGELTHTQLLKILTEFKITRKELESFPPGILLPLKKALNEIENSFSQIDPTIDVDIISREDISRYIKILNGDKKNYSTSATKKSINDNLGNDKPTTSKTILSILSEVILSAGYAANEKSSILGNPEQHEDMDEGNSLKKNSELIFSEDKRFNEVLSLLSFSKVQNVPFVTRETEYTKILTQKKRFAEIFALRSCAQGIGWGAVVYSTEKPLSTQKWYINDINFCTSFPDKTKIKVEKEQINKEFLEWGKFHSGVSSGLKISKKTKGISGSWIAFNKPKEVNASHAGFLLGLGLNGHLKNLEEWHIYNYLSLKSTYIGIGLLLGMSSSMKGSMDLTLTKILSIHVAALLPKGANDLNIDIKVQTAGLVSLGQLFLRSRHKKMTSLLIDQLSSLVSINEELVADEGYRMAAGIAIGLINLGAGPTLTEHEKHESPVEIDEYDSDTNFVLPEDSDANSYELISNKLLEFICDYHDAEMDWLPQNSQIGACLAITLMFLKSGNKKIAEQVAVSTEDIRGQSNCRPELIMYKEFAYHMIMWDTIQDSTEFLMRGIHFEASGEMTSDKLPIYYAIAGRVLSLGIKFASTGRKSLKKMFLTLIDKLVRFYQYPGKNTVDFKLVILSVNVLINTLLVSTSMVMCATGDLDVFRRLRYFHEVVTGKDSCQYDYVFKSDGFDDKSYNRDNETENPVGNGLGIIDPAIDQEPGADDLGLPSENHNDSENQYSKFIATSLSMGFLFLGSGQYALKNNELESLAYLIISVLPTFLPPYPLQELKHFWSLAVEPRCLLVRDALTNEPVLDLEIVLTSKDPYTTNLDTETLRTPCLLPDISRIKSISVISSEYFPLELVFTDEFPASKYFINGTILYVQPRNHAVNLPNSGFYHGSYASTDVEFLLKKKISSNTEESSKKSFSCKLLGRLDLDKNYLNETRNEFENVSHGWETMNDNLSLIYKSRIQPADIDDELSVWWSLQDAQK
ncbi:Anaphase-promoting complex subunit 1 [Nakaseomyces bracarensis]|uniref:Anaphase-promoting complex subunit 1 n=1 Tax=Nakaseomyces bracarensis TaxID=273131 RepID=A0ABR4NUS3_9SACH